MKRPLYCQVCHRPVLTVSVDPSGIGQGVSGYVAHEGYGCDSGCCGHAAYLLNAAGEIVDEHFGFVHPCLQEDYRVWAEDFLQGIWPEVSLDWERCEITDD